MRRGSPLSVILPVEAPKLPAEDYPNLRARLRDMVQASTPEGAVVIVISKGDPELISFARRTGWHFPQTENGSYAGAYPSSADQAIAELDALRVKGGRYLAVPAFAFWWFGYYERLSTYLTQSYRLLLRQDDTCVIFDLGRSAGDGGEENDPPSFESIQQCRDLAETLLPDGVTVAIAANGNAELMKLPRQQVIEFPPDARFGESSREATGLDEVRRDLTSARRAGADFLVLPAVSVASISSEYAIALRSLLESEHRLVTRQQHVAEIWRISDAPPGARVMPEARRENSESRKKRMMWWRRK